MKTKNFSPAKTFFIITILSYKLFNAQVGINTTTPDANTVLDVVSNTKGILIPRLTQTEANTLDSVTPADGTLIYNSTVKCVQIYKRTSSTAGDFNCLVTTSDADTTNDAWINDNTQVKLGTLSNGSTVRPAGTEFVAKDDGKVGIGTSTPQKNLHIHGGIQLTNELNVGGNATATGSPGTAGQILVSGGAGVSPSWVTPTTVHGDVKLSFMTTDHNGWILLDGRPINTLNSAQRTRATALGFSTNLPNANNAYPVDNGTTVGTVTGSNTKIISQANLPNVNLTATTSTNGNHSHNTRLWENNSAAVTGGYKFYTRTSSGNTEVTPNTTADGEHSHNVSVPLNGGINQTSFDVTPKSISVKMFVYLGQ